MHNLTIIIFTMTYIDAYILAKKILVGIFVFLIPAVLLISGLLTITKLLKHKNDTLKSSQIINQTYHQNKI